MGDFRISMRISVESVMCRFGTGARTLLLLAMMSLVEITAMGPSYSTSVYVPAAMRAVAVLTPFSVHDYIESEGILFPRGMVPKYPKMIPDFKPIDDYSFITRIHQDLAVIMRLPSPPKMPNRWLQSLGSGNQFCTTSERSRFFAHGPLRSSLAMILLVMGSLPQRRCANEFVSRPLQQRSHCHNTVTIARREDRIPTVDL